MTSIKSKKDNQIVEKNSKFKIKFNIKSDFLFLLILFVNIIELISWFINKTPFNAQTLAAVDIKIIITQLSDFVPYMFFVVVFCVIIIFFPFYEYEIEMPNIYILTIINGYTLLFLFSLTILRDFHDENNNSLFDSKDDGYYSILRRILFNKYEMKPRILSSVKQPKSLMLIQLESYPYEMAKEPIISPNLFNFSQRYEILAPIESEPYTAWSLAGMAVTQTGIPQIYPDPKFYTLAHDTDFEYILGIKGIPDLLFAYNYTLNYAVTGNIDVMGFDRWVFNHSYSRVYKGKNDLYLYNHLTEKYLIEIDKNIRDSQFNKRYLTLVVNSNTHSPYTRPRWCKLAFPEMIEIQKCFHCIDFAVGRVINKFLELKMYEHTLLVVFPDHKPFNTNYKQLFVLFPGMEKVDSNSKIEGQVSYYDFTPTILDLIGIKKYQPECPFGRKIYNNTSESDRKYCFNNKCIQKHVKPTIDDLTFMYKFIHHEHGKSIKGKYNLSNPFTCLKNGSNEYYYSDVPCVNNIRGVTPCN